MVSTPATHAVMLVEELAVAVESVRQHSSRLKKIEILSVVLLEQEPSREALLYFLCGELPMGKIGIGPATVHKAGKELESSKTHAVLTVANCCSRLAKMKQISGPGSKARRHAELLSILHESGGEGQRFLLRLLSGGLRQGALAGVVEQAVVRASAVEAGLLRRAVTLTGSVPQAAMLAFEGGDRALREVKIELFRPLAPMLAATAENPEQALQKWSPSFWEIKMDGARIQVHREGGVVRVFSRALREVTTSVPEVVEQALNLPAERFILDGEVLSFRSDGRPIPFQKVMRRFGRKNADAALREELPLTPFYFDILLFEQEELLMAPFHLRRRKLEELVGPGAVPGQRLEDAQLGEEYLDQVMEQGYEGVMVKRLNGAYQSGKRGADWLKLKPHHTLDLVVVACEWGSGRRRGWLSNLHLAAPDENGNLVMLGKTFKGLTDEMLRWQTEKFLSLEVSRDDYTVYIAPEVVVEIAFNELQESSHYPGGMALRFARVKRYREDKQTSQADTLQSVREIFEKSR